MLREKVRNHETAPYVYLYPTPRMLEEKTGMWIFEPEFTDDLNIYIHIPFCRQKCTWCGYLTVTEKASDASADLQEKYVDCIVKEIQLNRDQIAKSNITSINFGGGTPSLLTPFQFARIMMTLVLANPNALDAEEISIEATPESIESGKIAKFQQFGLNRVSVGVESFIDSEMHLSSRHNTSEHSVNTLETLKELKIPNVCVDLMYGLPGQTFESWKQSVRKLIAIRPQTVELYATSSVSGTSFSRTKPVTMSQREKLDCYHEARNEFLKAGYQQDSHIRFVLPGSAGGYIQQANVFKGQSLLGFGVGARSYAKNLHYRNTYEASNPRKALDLYIKTVQNRLLPVKAVSLISNEDKMRQFVIYNLDSLNKTRFKKEFGVNVLKFFWGQFNELFQLELATDNGEVISLTPKGLGFRDVIAREFFSWEAKKKEAMYREGALAA